MNHFALFVLSLSLAGLHLAAAPAAPGEEWTKTYSISGKPELRVETTDADIRVDAWDQNTIEARVTSEYYKMGERGIRITEHQTGDSVQIEVRFPNEIHFFDMRRRRVNVEIHMPREGRLNLHTGDGNIQVSNLKGSLDLESSDGNQELDGVDGVLRARAGDGHIRVTGRFDGLELSTGDGRIEARALPGSNINSSWSLHAGDGSVTLQLPDHFAADVDLHTGDGHITLDMPVTVEGKLGEKNIRGKMNGGGNLLTVHTGDGSIRLEKS
jgi:DUF4097 and DUF4098 domain-containing protein YvlB